MIPSPEGIDQAIAAAPTVVQEYIREGTLADTIVSIGQRFGLHVDTIGKLAELSRNMLIGLSSPAEVVGELIMSGMDAETAKKLLTDLNGEIFIPIREQMRNPKPSEEQVASTSHDVSPHETPIPTPPTPRAAVVEAPAPPRPVPPPYVHNTPTTPPPPRPAPVWPLPPKSVPAAAVIAPTPVPPAPAPVVPPVSIPVPQPPIAAPIPPPKPAAPLPPPPPPPHYVPTPESRPQEPQERPAMRTMATDMQAVKEHRVPEPIFASPTPHPMEASVPAPVLAPVQPEPRATPTEQSSVAAPHPLPQTSPRTLPPPLNLPGVPKQYSNDPYREPIE